MKMGEVIDFEEYKRKREAGELPEQQEPKISVEEISVEITKDIIMSLIEEFDCDPRAHPNSIHEILVIIECLKSFAYRTTGRDYPWSDVLDGMMAENHHKPTIQEFMATLPDDDGPDFIA